MTTTPGPTMTSKRAGPAAVGLGDNRVLVIGGAGNVGSFSDSTEILDLGTMTTTRGPTMI